MSDLLERPLRTGLGLPDGRPFRLGFLLHLDSDVAPEQAFADAVRLFRVAEEVGYDSGWVIQRHFRQGNEHLSSPLVLLAAIAAQTRRIRLGTGVLVLPLEDPLRVAEDAATLDALSGGRLELGVGSGPFPGAWEAFGRPLDERHGLFDASVSRLRAVLEGTPLNSQGERLHPSGSGVSRRLWQAIPSSPEVAVAAAAAAGRAGDGLQLSRATGWNRNQDEAAQAQLVEAYHSAHQETWDSSREPRVLVSRAVYPDADRDRALRVLEPGARRWQSWIGKAHGDRPGIADLSPEEYLFGDRTRFGPAKEVADGLAADVALRSATDLLVSFVPAVPDVEEHERLLRSVATDVAPRLGWSPAETR